MELDNLFVVTKRWAKDNDCLNDNKEADLERVSKVLNTNEFIIDIDSFLRPLTTEEAREIIQKAIEFLSKEKDESTVEKPCKYKIHYLSNGKIM